MKTLTRLFTLLLMASIISCSGDCDPGYEGENCDILINEKFFGTYTTTTSDCGSGNASTIGSIAISANAAGDGQSVSVELTRSSGQTGTGIGTIIDGVLSVTAEVTVFSAISYELNGTISDGVFIGSEITTVETTTSNCTITMEK